MPLCRRKAAFWLQQSRMRTARQDVATNLLVGGPTSAFAATAPIHGHVAANGAHPSATSSSVGQQVWLGSVGMPSPMRSPSLLGRRLGLLRGRWPAVDGCFA